MKSTIKHILFFTAAISTLAVSCAKEIDSPIENADDQLVEVTLIAGNPEVLPTTKTEMVGSQPYWSVKDAIGVSNGTTTNYKFSTDIEAKATSASFTGLTAVSSTLYAYYPFTNNGVGQISEKYGAKVDLPANQNPTATSFDGSADIMVAKQFTVDPENTTVEDLEFARLGAVVKIVLIDKDNTMTGTQHPTTVSMTAESMLAGRLVIDMQNQEISEPYYNTSSTVTASYSAETKYAIDGSNATYLIVYPQTLAEGTTLTIAASTENYSLSKDITVPKGGIELLPGKLTTLNVKFEDTHITISNAGASLPFKDDFSWQTGTGTNAISFTSDPALPSTKYSAGQTLYRGNATGVVRMSTSSATGSLTTVELDLSSAFYVHINAKAWNGSELTKLYVNVDDGVAQEIQLKENYDDYYVNFAAATKKSKVKVTTESNKRAYFKAIDVISGTYVVPPVINVTTGNPMAVANTASTQTIKYTIDNPTIATLTAALKEPAVDWISNIDYSTSGEVTFDVAPQPEKAPARNAVIVLSYTGAPDVEVKVNQEAGVGSTKDYTVTWTASAAANLGSTISSQGGTDSGTIATTCADPELSYNWNYTRSLVKLNSGKTDYLAFSDGYIQMGSKNALENAVFSTSNIPGTIKTVTVDCWSYNGAHNITISVGGNTYLDNIATPSASGNTKTGTGSSSGEIVISFTDGSRALYIKSITVVYNK